jgi:potassium efflux system protein
MDRQFEVVATVLGYFDQARELALSWLTSPAAWSQFALLLVAFGLALLANRRLLPRLKSVITPPENQTHFLASSRRFLLIFLPLLLPILAYGLTAAGEQVTRSVFGSGAVIAFGKRLFLLLAARALMRDIITDPFLKIAARYVLMPVMILYALGVLG